MSDPAISRDMAEFMKKIPFSQHLGIRVDSLEKGVARLSMEIRPEFMTSWGTAHGGSVLSLLDITLSMAARTLYDPPRSIMTIDLSTQFIGTATGVLKAEGRVMKAGNTTIFCEGEARDGNGELAAKAIGTFRARSPK
ncbi:MAG: PaaI family thioesterase [Candidatus Parcubacteria bacterium]|nr:PaaI family thioesterase [Burkholderiales bacterium]